MRDQFTARGRKLTARAQQFTVDLLQLPVDSRQLRVARFQARELALSVVAERHDFRHARAVLAPEGVQQIQSFLQFTQPLRVHIHVIGVARQFRLDLSQCRHRLFMRCGDGARAGIDTLQLVQRPAQRSRLRQQRALFSVKLTERSLAQFHQLRRIARPLVILLHLHLLARLEFGFRDFTHLETQQVELLRVGLLIDHERGLLGLKRSASTNQFRKAFALALQFSKRIENSQLPRGVEQRLVVVWPVDVHQPFADGAKGLQRGRRAVDELPVGTGGGEGALEHELSVLAWLQPVFVEEFLQRSLKFAHLEDGLDRATVRPAADERAVGALTQDERQCADEDAFPSASFASDDVEAGPQLYREVCHESEVLDAESSQHVEIGRAKSVRCANLWQKKFADVLRLHFSRLRHLAGRADGRH